MAVPFRRFYHPLMSPEVWRSRGYADWHSNRRYRRPDAADSA